MNNVAALHMRAMDLMDESLASRKMGNGEKADELLNRAFTVEAEAANSLLFEHNAEPSRSILYRSAASLALQCGFLEEGERLVHRGLAGEPPVSIAEQLRMLLDELTFRRHLSLRGLVLSSVDLQVSLEGNGIGPGIAPTAEVLPRVTGTNLLLYRTAERLQNLEYREAGRPKSEIKDVSESFMSLPRAASYAFSLSVGRIQQMSFVDPSEQLIDEMLDCLSLIEEGKESALRERITDAAYYNNFISLAQNILPDGDNVKTVGFTVQRKDSTREVALRQTAATIRESFAPVLARDTKRIVRGTERPIEVSGQLKLADSVHETNRIQVVPENGKAVTIYVPEGMMTDIVRPLWEEWVTVEGLKMGRSITLINIRKYR